MTTLREAAQAVVDRWDTPAWKDVPHTGEFINALRAALAEPEPTQEPVAFVNRRNVEQEIRRAEHPTGMQLNDGKERVTLPGGTLRLMLRLIDTHSAPPQTEVEHDAARYRWLREQHWNYAAMCVVESPKTALILGSRCPSGTLLDAAIDAAIGPARGE
jgi:hypothetical protein